MAATRAASRLRMGLKMWGLAALFYLIDFFQRVSPAALSQELSRELAPTAVALGGLSSVYFLSYAGLQLPIGLLVDRYGPRRMLTLACALGTLGSLCFGLAESLEMASVARLILGASGAVAWIAMLKLGSSWFAPEQFARISALSLCVGATGAILSGLPLRALADLLGWRVVMLSVAGLSALLALVIWRQLQDQPALINSPTGPTPKPEVGTDPGSSETSPTAHQPVQRSIYRDLFWLCLGQMGITGAMASLAWLWAVPYLSSQFSLSQGQATWMTSLMMIFFATGSMVFGSWSDRIQQRQKPLGLGTLGVGLGLLVLASGLTRESLPSTLLVLWGLGFCAGAMGLSFAWGKELVSGSRTATVIAIVNCCVMLGSIVLPPLFGAVLDLFWQGEAIDGVRRYTAEGFQWGFLGLGLWVLLTLVFQAQVRNPGGVRRTRAGS